MRVLLENTSFLLHKIVRIAGIIRGRALYEEIRYLDQGRKEEIHAAFYALII